MYDAACVYVCRERRGGSATTHTAVLFFVVTAKIVGVAAVVEERLFTPLNTTKYCVLILISSFFSCTYHTV